MEKPKAKRDIPDNTPDWLEPLLFRETFAYDVDAPLPVVSASLQGLDIPSTSVFQQRMRTVMVEGDGIERLSFTITAKIRGRSLYTPSAIARGVAVAVGETTHIHGYARLSLVGVALLFVPLFMAGVMVVYLVGGLFLRVLFAIPLFAAFVIAVVVGFAWWRFTQIRDDRDRILDDLAATVRRDGVRKAKREPGA